MMQFDKVKIIVCTICAILFYLNCFHFVSYMDNSHNKNDVGVKSPSKHPWLRSTDIIYNGERNTVPIVNEEYRIVFFLTAKVASTEFIRFFTRLQRDNPNWCKANIHHANVHKLKLLNDFSLDEAHDIKDVHWRSIYSRIDEKWWPYIDKIGYMDTLTSDVKYILSSIHSTIDGVSAWDCIGASGWSGDKTNTNCSINLQSDIPFLGKGDSKHTTSANALDKLKNIIRQN